MRKQEFRFQTNLPSPARRRSRSRPPLRRPRPLRFERLRMSRSECGIQPRPPQPCEVGRPKGRRRKNRRQSHNFFKHLPSGSHPSPSLHLCCKPLECLDLGEKSDGGLGESASKCPDCYVKQIYFHFDLRWLS